MSVAQVDICHRAIVAQIKIDDIALSGGARTIVPVIWLLNTIFHIDKQNGLRLLNVNLLLEWM